MKKLKKISAALLIFVMMLSLCSCAELDQLRERQAFFNENGIVYKDRLYKLVNTADDLNYNFINAEFINVTDEGVPVLLSAMINFEYTINADETIINGSYDDEWYVREDKYPEYESSVKNGINYTDIGFDYYDASLVKKVDYILTEQEKTVLLSLLDGEVVTEDFETYEELYLFEQSDNRLFRKSDCYVIIRADNGYYVGLCNDGYMTGNIYKSSDVADRMFDSFFERVNANLVYEF